MNNIIHTLILPLLVLLTVAPTIHATSTSNLFTQKGLKGGTFSKSSRIYFENRVPTDIQVYLKWDSCSDDRFSLSKATNYNSTGKMIDWIGFLGLGKTCTLDQVIVKDSYDHVIKTFSKNNSPGLPLVVHPGDDCVISFDYMSQKYPSAPAEINYEPSTNLTLSIRCEHRP